MARENAVRVDADSEGAHIAAGAIAAGGLVIYPTDTTYAIGANAVDQIAVQALRQLKGRSSARAMSIMVSELGEIACYAIVGEREMELASALLPGPVTLLFNPRQGGPTLACSDTTVGIRIPDARFCRQFAGLADVPITATSANLTGTNESYSLDQAIKNLGPKVSDAQLFVDGGTLPLLQPSTVIDLTGAAPRVVREGAFTSSELERLIARR